MLFDCMWLFEIEIIEIKILVIIVVLIIYMVRMLIFMGCCLWMEINVYWRVIFKYIVLIKLLVINLSVFDIEILFLFNLCKLMFVSIGIN